MWGLILDNRELDYFKTCCNFCATLTHLSVNHRIYHNSIMGNNDEHNTINIFDSLPKFNQLKDLILYNSVDKNLTTFDVQHLCPKLTSLNFITRFKVPDIHVEEEEQNNLQTVVIHLLNLTVNYINYLKAHFPAGSLTSCGLLRIIWISITGCKK